MLHWKHLRRKLLFEIQMLTEMLVKNMDEKARRLWRTVEKALIFCRECIRWLLTSLYTESNAWFEQQTTVFLMACMRCCFIINESSIGATGTVEEYDAHRKMPTTNREIEPNHSNYNHNCHTAHSNEYLNPSIAKNHMHKTCASNTFWQCDRCTIVK